MTVRRFLWSTVIVTIVAAYLAGYWPERQQRVALEAENASLRARVTDAEAHVRVAHLLGELMHVTEAIEVMNYGQAQTLSSDFFDNVLTEAGRTSDADFRSMLDSILQDRDATTGALARADQAALETLRDAQTRLREALEYPVERRVEPSGTATAPPSPALPH